MIVKFTKLNHFLMFLIKNLKIKFHLQAYKQIYGPYENKPVYICLSQLLQPKSRGTVTLQSANPFDSPLIDPNYFSDPRDLDAVVEGKFVEMETCISFITKYA